MLSNAFNEYGLSGFMQPMVSFEKGFCNYDCTICSDICPQGHSNAYDGTKHVNQMGQVEIYNRKLYRFIPMAPAVEHVLNIALHRR